MTQKVPLLNLPEQYQLVSAELEQAVLTVLRTGNYILGQNGVKLENQVAAVSGATHGIGVANGTDALVLALWALDIGPGDEVITPPFTFAATVEAIVLRGATPVFVDVDENTFNLDAKLIEKAVTPKTKAIMPVHLYGLPANMDAIMEIATRFNLKVVEDNAQGIGATYKGQSTGSFGDLACTSFYPTKNLGAAGDAGMIVTSKPELAERLKSLRAHGMKKRYYHDELGVNSRLDEIQAAVLLAKLPHLANWNKKRHEVSLKYEKALATCPGIKTPQVPSQDYTHVWHQYTIRVLGDSTMRDAVAAELNKRGIGSMCYYPIPLHLQQAFQHLNYKKGDFPISEKLADQVLSLPMYPELTDAQINEVAKELNGVMVQMLGATAPVSTPVFTG